MHRKEGTAQLQVSSPGEPMGVGSGRWVGRNPYLTQNLPRRKISPMETGMHLSSWIDLRKAAATLLRTGGLLLCGISTLQAARSASVASGKNGVVVAGEKRAAEIGTRVLEKGGNAADATTAALLALSVT